VKYILSMIGEYVDFADLPPDKAQALERAITTYNEELEGAGVLVSGEGLGQPSAARTIRFSGDQATVGDGPYLDGSEQVSGFWIIEAPSIDEAIVWAKKVPLADGAVEIRELV
jgi:hypothetical protein